MWTEGLEYTCSISMWTEGLEYTYCQCKAVTAAAINIIELLSGNEQ